MLNLLRRLFRTPESDATRVLRILQAHRGEWVGGLYRRSGCMVHSRVAQLRKRGHRISCKCFGAGDWRYRLEVDA
jgi:hypothetical protein